MRLHNINEGEYDGLEDNDEFGNKCDKCNLSEEVVEIYDFNGEQICEECIQEIPIRDRLKFSPEATLEEIEKKLFSYLYKDGYQQELEVMNSGDGHVLVNFPMSIYSRQQHTTDMAAQILAQQIGTAKNAIKKLRNSGGKW